MIVALLLVVPLVDRNYDYAFESDAHDNLSVLRQFLDVLHTRWMTRPAGYPPFLDGVYLAYIPAALLARTGLFSGLGASGDLGQLVFAYRWTNVAAFALCAAFMFLAARLVSRSNAIAFVLTVAFLLSPQIIEIDLLRVDWVIIFLLCATIFLSLRIMERPDDRLVFAGLALSAAFLFTTKISSAVFALIPAAAVVLSRQTLRRKLRTGLVLFGAIGVLACCICWRYLYFELTDPGFLVEVLRAKLLEVSEWTGVLGVEPRHAYLWDSYLVSGTGFILGVWMAVGYAAIQCYRFRNRPVAVLLAGLCVIAVGSLFAFKYSRGAYPFLPFYLLLGAAALGWVLGTTPGEGRKRYSVAATVVIVAIWLVPTIGTLSGQYLDLRERAAALPLSMEATRFRPRAWLQRNVVPGARICLMAHSGWAVPPLDGVEVSISNGPFRFPYWSRSGMEQFAPPALSSLREQCDLILLNDFHPKFILDLFSRFGFQEMRTNWERFFDSLDSAYPVFRFTGATPNYSIQEVKVVVVNEATLTSHTAR